MKHKEASTNVLVNGDIGFALLLLC